VLTLFPTRKASEFGQSVSFSRGLQYAYFLWRLSFKRLRCLCLFIFLTRFFFTLDICMGCQPGSADSDDCCCVFKLISGCCEMECCKIFMWATVKATFPQPCNCRCIPSANNAARRAPSSMCELLSTLISCSLVTRGRSPLSWCVNRDTIGLVVTVRTDQHEGENTAKHEELFSEAHAARAARATARRIDWLKQPAMAREGERLQDPLV